MSSSTLPMHEGALRTAMPEGSPALSTRVSWGAILAGGVVAVMVGLTLNVLGAAIGVSAVDPDGGDTPSATTFGISTGVWLLVANLVGLFVGGYVAARLSGSSDRTDSGLHGIAVWAVGYLLAVVLLGNVIGGTASTAFRGAGAAIGGAAQGVGQAAQAAAGPLAQAASSATQGLDPRQLIERAQTALRGGGGDPAQMTGDQRTAEIGQLLTRRVTDGDLPRGDRERLTALIAAEYGISPEDAQTRLRQVEEQVTRTRQEVERRATEAAKTAKAAAATAAYWAFGAMLLGALAALIGARAGTRNLVVRRTV